MFLFSFDFDLKNYKFSPFTTEENICLVRLYPFEICHLAQLCSLSLNYNTAMSSCVLQFPTLGNDALLI